MDKFTSEDVEKLLREIAENNTFFHLENDLGISVDQMKRAINSIDPAENTLIWVSCPSGIDCYSEREMFLKDTRAYNGIMYHAFDNQSERKLAYAVEITGIGEDGILEGTISEIDLKQYATDKKENAIPFDSYRIFTGEMGDMENSIVIPKHEFDARYPSNLPQMSGYRHEPAVAFIPTHTALVEAARQAREASGEPNTSWWAHTIKLRDSIYEFYANDIIKSMNKLPEPNSADRQSFTASLNSYVENCFNVERKKNLMEALPFQNVEFSMKKGQRGFHVIIPRDEIMALRGEPQEKREKPSILAKIQEKKDAAKAVPEKPVETRTTPKKNNDKEV